MWPWKAKPLLYLQNNPQADASFGVSACFLSVNVLLLRKNRRFPGEHFGVEWQPEGRL
jgi:hypothetical protein